MNEKLNVDINTLKIIYAKYREHILFIFIILVCLILFLTVIIPRIRELVVLSKNAKSENKRLITLQNNLNFLSNLSDSTLDSQFNLVSSALPAGKDFEGILNAISLAAIKSGVSLSDYDFQVGDLSQTSINVSGFPFLKLSLNIKADPKKTVSFLNELYKTLPLSEVITISESNNFSSITILFYYKPMRRAGLKNDEPITTISSEGLKLISELSFWNSNLTPSIIATSSSSPSASSAASPF